MLPSGSQDEAAVPEQEKAKEPRGAVGKKSLLLPSGGVLLHVLTVFTVFS